MSAALNRVKEIYYPETDGKPMGETDWHIKLIMNLRTSLENYFRDNENVYVSCDLLLYYEEGNPKKFVVPDVMVVRGVKKGLRRIYKVWDEGKSPCVVIEIVSKETWKKDVGEKLRLYADLGVKEYYAFDPEYKYLKPPFRAFRLVDGKFEEVKIRGGRIYSEELGLELVDTGKSLRLWNPVTKEFLLTPEESEEERKMEREARLVEREVRLQETERLIAEMTARKKAEEEAKRAEEEAKKAGEDAKKELAARLKVESELASALEELARLKTEKGKKK
jgi:Uma2 family endonuclease